MIFLELRFFNPEDGKDDDPIHVPDRLV
jgi:hypothetical protein